MTSLSKNQFENDVITTSMKSAGIQLLNYNIVNHFHFQTNRQAIFAIRDLCSFSGRFQRSLDQFPSFIRNDWYISEVCTYTQLGFLANLLPVVSNSPFSDFSGPFLSSKVLKNYLRCLFKIFRVNRKRLYLYYITIFNCPEDGTDRGCLDHKIRDKNLISTKV